MPCEEIRERLDAIDASTGWTVERVTDALRAVLDLCDMPANRLFCLTADEIESTIAHALGVPL